MKRRGWARLMFFVGVIILIETVPEFRMDRNLTAARSRVGLGVVQDWSYERRKRQPDYRVAYSFSNGERQFTGRYACSCRLLETIRDGDSIPIRFALANPSINRPEGVENTLTYDTVAMIVALSLLAVGGGDMYRQWRLRTQTT